VFSKLENSNWSLGKEVLFLAGCAQKGLFIIIIDIARGYLLLGIEIRQYKNMQTRASGRRALIRVL
jgi:hypothetical protein